MIPLPGKLIAAQIISSLLRKPAESAESLRKQITIRGNQPASIQAIYKELRHLQRQQIVFKARSRYFLSLTWLLDMQNEIVQGIERYETPLVMAHLLPALGQTQRWKFTDIHAMDRLNVNLMIAILKHSVTKEIYHWDPYPWYALFHNDLAKPFLSEFTRSGFHAYGIIGTRSPITSKLVQLQKRFGHTWWIGHPTFPHKDNISLTAKPPFILSIRYPNEAIEVFKAIFKAKNPTPTYVANQFHRLLHHKLTYTLTIEHNPKKATLIASRFRKHLSV